ncbi:protealysin inhibitor emfourin [Nonomuraea guangzhouensis]|uniref:Protealysin inhibitor emfourin n=1 Tax=Nonomuraea guangzhouensis TaxID=1291555 RepID=A0ABW4G390_9ACTN|nr:protealysin inhibitor emfourin [Nonomuraea guangzhouensis]
MTLETSGGFTGLRRHVTLDTDLDDDLRSVLTALSAAEPAATPATAAQPRYRLTVHHPTGDQTTELTEPDVPAALRPLLTELLRHATPF